MLINFVKIAFCSILVLSGLTLLVITINAIRINGYEFLPCTIFLIGSIGMLVEGIKGFIDIKNEKKSSTLTIYYSK
jgi:hypothetical protein